MTVIRGLNHVRTDYLSDPSTTLTAMLDLVLPLECGGCQAPGTRWCTTCAHELRLRPDQPELTSPRVDPGVPVFALGRYAGARRKAIVAAKEHGRTDLLPPLALAVRAGLDRLCTWGLLDLPVTLVPAPTRWTSARRRGGDPVVRIARLASGDLCDVAVAQVLSLRPFARDSVGLSSAQRERNIAGRVRQRTPVSGPVVLLDDVVTTGATAAESVRTLQTHGAQVTAVLVLAHA